MSGINGHLAGLASLYDHTHKGGGFNFRPKAVAICLSLLLVRDLDSFHFFQNALFRTDDIG